LQACKTQTAADVPPFVPVEVLYAGEEPRDLLRYGIVDGTTTTSIVSWKAKPREKGVPAVTVSGLRTMDVTVVFGPASITEDEIRYDSEIIKSKAATGAGVSEKLLENIEGHVDSLRGVAASVAMDDRGRGRGVRSNQKASGVPLRLLWVVENTTSLLSLVKLPDEAVGIGARWKVRGRLSLHDVEQLQEATYTLVERTGDEIVLDVEFERVGDRQVLDFGDAGGRIEVESSQSQATGRLQLDLTTLGSNATASGTLRDRVVIVEGESREKREINEAYEVRIRSTSTVR
jgi:hypothetical protein